MYDKYDIYLYNVQDPDRLVRVADIPMEDAQAIANEFWDADVNNDCMIVTSLDEWWFEEPDISEATMATWQEAVSSLGGE